MDWPWRFAKSAGLNEPYSPSIGSKVPIFAGRQRRNLTTDNPRTLLPAPVGRDVHLLDEAFQRQGIKKVLSEHDRRRLSPVACIVLSGLEVSFVVPHRLAHLFHVLTGRPPNTPGRTLGGDDDLQRGEEV